MVSVAKFDQWQSTAGTVRGTVLQVVQGSTSTQVASSSTTYTDTGLSATITPTSTTSKIFVLVSQSTYKSQGHAQNAVHIRLLRGAVDLGSRIYIQGYMGGTATELYTQAAFTYLDSPNTLSTITYKTQFANYAPAAQVAVQPNNVGVSTITLMEIQA